MRREPDSEPRQTVTRSAPTQAAPRYFHLLWDEELDALRPIFEAIRSQRDAVLENWHRLYRLHFGDTRSLTKPEFLDIFGWELDAILKDLLAKDVGQFAADVRRVGERLAERQVPFSELIVSMHLFEESAAAVFPTFPQATTATYLAFDKLSHCQIVILADTYFRSRAAVASARIRALEREARNLPAGSRTRFRGLVGASAPMRALYERIEAAGATRGTVLIVGESGTGKELAARAIHECGANSNAPFVALNCAAIPRDLIESELFGYKRGAFSGAIAEYLGLFRAAEGGTLFLDEVTEMSAETQSKLLRAIQEWSVRPVGSTREVPVDVRLIASTNRDPTEAVRSGQLRADLYYRLQASVLTMPPLRDHLEDVPLLVEHFIELFNEKMLRPSPVAGIEDDALEALKHYSWPGNVRELQNAIEGAFTFGKSAMIRLQDLPGPIGGHSAGERSAGDSGPVGTFAEAERHLIRRALETTEGNKAQAAKLLKISRKKLYAKIAKYGLD
ncbi:MAG TPA: sigma 54-interacting transcriptional regulator [Candidatus Binataceae bacterium]|nr:sigma 54-interacting transcriptional regulator [Candidatus Binataceae bacterium]